ncbi:hypothetical protein M433DRAFT_155389 [Acidomyces richmondensis BFW]|nr:MAG: hypothetical protein FE78DRAFT_92142 [Acidomyces sp. 'richmondensis']KYG44641.1 hypothetical protein M433DRAFT_155389 [Acidomyces richmondensis BFW]
MVRCVIILRLTIPTNGWILVGGFELGKKTKAPGHVETDDPISCRSSGSCVIDPGSPEWKAVLRKGIARLASPPPTPPPVVHRNSSCNHRRGFADETEEQHGDGAQDVCKHHELDMVVPHMFGEGGKHLTCLGFPAHYNYIFFCGLVSCTDTCCRSFTLRSALLHPFGSPEGQVRQYPN